MYRIDNNSAVGAIPTPEAAGTPGFFTDGDPTGGVEATIVDADWLNAIQEELLNVVTAASITPSKTNRTQLLAAIGKIVGTGRVLRIKSMIASAAHTPIPGMVNSLVFLQGAGGGGGGLITPSVGNVSCGAPGASGSLGVGLFTAAQIGSSISVVIGAGGAVAVSSNGAAGGASTFGALMTAPGGAGGLMLNNQVPPNFNGNGSISGAPTGANVYQEIGSCPDFSFGATAGGPYGGPGGPSAFGNGGNAAGTNSSGVVAQNYGSGGGGTGGGSGSANLSGGAGKSGFCLIVELS